jgi:preprotein translocase subunit SecD
MLYFARWKVITILALAFFGCFLALPNFLSPQTRDAIARRVPSWVPSWVIPTKAMVLGLDLQGGSHVLLEVDANDLLRSQIEILRDEVRRVAREARVPIPGGVTLQPRGVQLRVPNPADRERLLPKLRELSQPITSTVLGQTGARTLEVTQLADGLVQLTLTQEGLTDKTRRAVDQAIEVLRRRIDALGTTEPNIQRQGSDRILVQVPGLQDPQRLKELLGRTAKLTFRLVDLTMTPEQAQGRPPPESEILYGTPKEGKQPYLIQRRVMVAGEDLTDAQPGFDQRTSEPIVTFRFNSNGARRFAQVTQENVGRPFAIVLDDEVISAPVIREPILGGSGQISGSFTVEQANDLAILLRAGALPAKLTIIEERTVGPSLGQDSIEAGSLAAYIGSAFVAVFMIAIYGLFGFFALAALAINVLMLFGIQSALQATLTLPGIAGIVLTIGMAVDSNVVIFERIRDEFREGRSAISAIDKGFSLALGTVMDANMTAFFAALILFAFGGSGPVRGFAVTFLIGLVTTAFTAYTLTRLMIATWVRVTRPARIPI